MKKQKVRKVNELLKETERGGVPTKDRTSVEQVPLQRPPAEGSRWASTLGGYARSKAQFLPLLKEAFCSANKAFQERGDDTCTL